MKVQVNKTDEKQEDLQLPRLMIDKNGVVLLVKKKISSYEYEVTHLSGANLGVTSKSFNLYNKYNPFTDFNGSITLSND